MRLDGVIWLVLVSLLSGCAGRSIRHDPRFDADALRSGALYIGGVSAMGSAPVPAESAYEAEIRRQFTNFWTNLAVLPSQAIDECAGADSRRALLKLSSENGEVTSSELRPLLPACTRARFLLLVNLDQVFETRSQSSREECSPLNSAEGAQTIWDRQARVRVLVRAAIYDLRSGSPVCEATARDASSHTGSSSSHPPAWPSRPDLLGPFGGAFFQLQHRLSHDLAGPRIPWIEIESDLE